MVRFLANFLGTRRRAPVSRSFKGALILVVILTGCLQQNAPVSAEVATSPSLPARPTRSQPSLPAVTDSATRPAAVVAAGPAYYVSPSGSDNNPGSMDKPWKRLSYAVTQLHAGDTLYMRAGTYGGHFYIENSGTQASPIVITNYNGEEVVVDGVNHTVPALESGSPLIGVLSDWVNLSNLTVQYSGDVGITVRGAHVTLDNIYSHHNWGSGVILSGNDDLIQNSRIWYNSMMNENGVLATAWAFGVSCARYPDHCTIRHTTVWNNWGEGISTFEALHTTIEDNISYNNQINFYISDTKYSLMRRNLSYCTPGNPIDAYQRQLGIYVADEKGVPIPLGGGGTRYPSSDNVFLNNLVLGCGDNIAFDPFVSANNVFAYNTFVNAAGTHEIINIKIYPQTGTNISFVNNLILQEDGNTIGQWSNTGITFQNNLWSKNPPASMLGAGSLVGNPLLAKTGSTAPGELTGAYFRVQNNSPAVDKGKVLAITATDYFSDFRGDTPDIGAAESNPLLLLPRLFLPAVSR